MILCTLVTSAKIKRTLTNNWISNFLKVVKTRNLVRQPAFLHSHKLEAKRSSTWPSFHATVTNSLVTCAFSGSDDRLPSVLCLSFYLQFPLHARNHTEALICHNDTSLENIIFIRCHKIIWKCLNKCKREYIYIATHNDCIGLCP